MEAGAGTKHPLLAAVLIASALVAACRPSDDSPARGFPPPPEPVGALYGRVLRADGKAAPRSVVTLTQLRTRTGPGDPNPAALGLGFGCPPNAADAADAADSAPGLCVNRASARVRAQGAFTFPQRSVRSGLPSVVTATYAPLAGGQWTGAETSAGLDDGPDPQEVPDLFPWEPKLFFASGGGMLRLRWTPLDVGLQSRAVRYTVEAVVVSTGSPRVRVAGPQESTTATIDTRQFEDAGYQVVVVAETAVAIDGDDASSREVVQLTYRSGSQPVPGRAGTGPAPSRGRPCLTDDLRGTLRPVEPCPLTDGDFGLHGQVSFPACPDDGSECTQTHLRVCVDLGESRAVGLVVYRTHHPYDQAVVELSADREQFVSVERPPGAGTSGVVSVPVDPPQQATTVCLRGPFTGPALQELSAW